MDAISPSRSRGKRPAFWTASTLILDSRRQRVHQASSLSKITRGRCPWSRIRGIPQLRECLWYFFQSLRAFGDRLEAVVILFSHFQFSIFNFQLYVRLRFSLTDSIFHFFLFYTFWTPVLQDRPRRTALHPNHNSESLERL